MSSILKTVFASFLGFLGFILAGITASILTLSVTIFNFVTSENFISLSFTNVGLNPDDPRFNMFVDVGWNLTRDLSNIIIVLAMIAIGLGTALRIEKYRAQKAIVPLIAIALLINFTPVILGIVIDASNIVMNFFIHGGFAGGTSMSNQFSTLWSSFLALDSSIESGWFNPGASTEAMYSSIGIMAMASFNIIAAVVYLLFSAVFAIRYVALWLLVILSPFAFVMIAVPGQKHVFDNWSKQFIQWCLVGVIGSFFLYLADHLLMMTSASGKGFNMGDITGGPGLSFLFNSLLGYSIPIILLFIGLIASVSSAPSVANTIMRTGQKYASKAGKGLGKGSLGALRAVPRISRVEEGLKKGMERIPGFGGPGSYASKLKSERESVSKNIGSLSTEGLRNVLSSPAITRDAKLRKAEAFKLLLEKNKIREEDKKYMANAIQFGVSAGSIYDKNPHWQISSDKAREQVEGMDPESFRKDISPLAFSKQRNPITGVDEYNDIQRNVFYGMDLSKVEELGKKGRGPQKSAVRRFVIDNITEMNAHISALRAAGQNNQADKIENVANSILRDSNYIA